MPIETLLLSALIGLLLALSYRHWQAIRALREKEAQAFVDSLLSVSEALEILNAGRIGEKSLTGAWENDNAYTEYQGFHAINTDELGRQSAAYGHYEDDTRPIPKFVEDALDRREDIETVEDDELPEAFRGWDKE